MFNLLDTPFFCSSLGAGLLAALAAIGGFSGLLDFAERLIFPIFKKNKALDKAATKFCKDYLAKSEEKNEKNEETPKNGV